MSCRNENRPGYKKTKMGWIPEDWEFVRLAKICTKIGSGITPKGGRDTYVDNGIPFIRSQNVQDGYFSYTGLAYLTEVQHEKMSGSAVLQGDVLYNITGASIGRACCFPMDILQANVNQHVCILRSNQNADPYFLNIQLNSSIGKKQLYENQAGGGREGLNFENLGAYTIPLPPIQEQKKISEILSTWDKSIQMTGKLIEKCELRKRGLLQVTMTSRLVSEKIVRFKEIFSPVKRRNSIGATRVLTASGEHGLVDQTEYFNRSVSGKDLSNYYLLKKGDFAYNRSFMNGYPYGALKRLDKYEEGVLSTLYLCFTPKHENCYSNFYVHLFESGILNRGLMGIVQMGARAHGLLNVSNSDFYNLKIPFPPIQEQKRIANILDTADREINMLKSKLNAIKEQKKGLMQKLLTGEVRVGPVIGDQ